MEKIKMPLDYPLQRVKPKSKPIYRFPILQFNIKPINQQGKGVCLVCRFGSVLLNDFLLFFMTPSYKDCDCLKAF